MYKTWMASGERIPNYALLPTTRVLRPDARGIAWRYHGAVVLS